MAELRLRLGSIIFISSVILIIILAKNQAIAGTIEKEDHVRPSVSGSESEHRVDLEDKSLQTNKNDSTMNNGNNNSKASTSEFGCVEDSVSKGESLTDYEICSGVSMECLHDSLKKLLQDPGKQEFLSRDYACILLNLLQKNQQHVNTISQLESNLKKNEDNLKHLTKEVSTHHHKFIPMEKLQHLEMKMNKPVIDKVSLVERDVKGLKESQALSQKKYSSELQNLKTGILENSGSIRTLKGVVDASSQSSLGKVQTLERSLVELRQKSEKWVDLSNKLNTLESRSSRTEVEIVGKMQEIIGKGNNLQNEILKVTTERENIKQDLRSQINSLKTEFDKKLSSSVKDSSNKSQELNEEFEKFRTLIETQLEYANKNLKEMLRIPITTMDKIETVLTSRISSQDEKIMKTEYHLENIINTTKDEIQQGFKSSLALETDRAIIKEQELLNLIMKERRSLDLLDKDFRALVNVESLRAKGTEAQLSSIITKEMEKANKALSLVDSKVEKLGSVLIEETKRAQEMEKGLLRKIEDESTRALSSEQGLLSNINAELSRASEREEELHKMMRKLRDVELRNLNDEVKALPSTFEKEVEEILKATSQFVEEQGKKMAHLQGKLKEHQEANNLKELEGTLTSSLNEAVRNQTTLIEGKMKVELDQIAENFEKAALTHLNLTEELGLMFSEFKEKQDLRNEEVKGQLGSFEGLVNSSISTAVEGVKEIFTEDLLILATEMGKKFTSFNESVDKKVEDIKAEVTALKNLPAKTPPTTTTTGGSSSVFSRLTNFFSRRPTYKRNSSQRKKERAETVETEDENDDKSSSSSKIHKKLRVEDVIGYENEDGEDDKKLVEELNKSSSEERRRKVGKSTSFSEEEEGEIPVVIQRSNSRVHNIFG